MKAPLHNDILRAAPRGLALNLRIALLVLLLSALLPSKSAQAQPFEPESAGTVTRTYSIHPSLPPFTLCFESEILVVEGDMHTLERIAVLRSGSVVQILTSPIDDMELGFEPDELTVTDIDFDGYGDLTVRTMCGAYGNCTFICWRYDRRSATFFYDSVLSREVDTPELDTVNRMLTFSYRHSAVGGGTWRTFKLVGREFRLIGETVLDRDGDNSSLPGDRIERTFTHRNGKPVLMRETVDHASWVDEGTKMIGTRTIRERRGGKMKVVRRMKIPLWSQGD